MDIQLGIIFLFMVALGASSNISVMTSSSSVSLINPVAACATWTHPTGGSADCVCGDSVYDSVICDNVTKRVLLKVSHCMTYSGEWNATVVGYCPYDVASQSYALFHSVPSDPIELDKKICRPMNRTGQMCGTCIEGYAPPVYSYSLACVECSDYKYNWLKYIAIAYLPLTIFYIIIILFRINISSPSVAVYVLLCQLVAIPPVMERMSIMNVKPPSINLVITAVYGVWNLDFFRAAYHPFCLHPHMTTLQTLALDYVVAVYPFCLILITFVLVKLHDKFLLVSKVWKPFRRCLSFFHENWDLSNSLIGAFGSFLLLSYVKIIYTSFAILVPTSLYTMNGTAHLYVLYDGTLQWLGGDHRHYAVLALVMFFFFNFLPLLLLCLYPCSCFHKSLNKCKLSFWTLHVLMDTIHGGYKLKPKDYRQFATVYLLIRLANLALYSEILFLFDYAMATGCLLLLCMFFVAVTEPYKKTLHNIIDTALLFCCGLSSVVFAYLIDIGDLNIENRHTIILEVFTVIVGTGLVVPPLYGIVVVLYHVTIPRKILQWLSCITHHLKNKVTKI